jgi:hypothetical protein
MPGRQNNPIILQKASNRIVSMRHSNAIAYYMAPGYSPCQTDFSLKFRGGDAEKNRITLKKTVKFLPILTIGGAAWI